MRGNPARRGPGFGEGRKRVLDGTRVILGICKCLLDLHAVALDAFAGRGNDHIVALQIGAKSINKPQGCPYKRLRFIRAFGQRQRKAKISLAHHPIEPVRNRVADRRRYFGHTHILFFGSIERFSG